MAGWLKFLLFSVAFFVQFQAYVAGKCFPGCSQLAGIRAAPGLVLQVGIIVEVQE